MPKCDRCGCTFDRDIARMDFDNEFMDLDYDNILGCLCGSCAIDAINSKDDGVYYETCENCGKRFDLIEEEAQFDSRHSWFNGTTLRGHWVSRILCCRCVMEEEPQ